MATIIRNKSKEETDLRFDAAGTEIEPTNWLDKTKTLVPGAVVAFWIAAIGAINSALANPSSTLLWIIFLVGLVGTWLVTNNELRNAKDYDPDKDRIGAQIFLTVISFAVWVSAFNGGGPFSTIKGYVPVYGELAVLAWTMLLSPGIAGFINLPKTESNNQEIGK